MSVVVVSTSVSYRMSNRISLSMLSNAFCRSIRMTCSSCPLLSCICARSSSDSIWSAVLRFFLNPYCGSAKNLVSSSLVVILSASILSRTLYHAFVSEIGLYFSGSFGFLASLGSRIIVASPIRSGTCFAFHTCSMRLCVISVVAFPPARSASAHMLSGPGALSFAMCCITFRISSLLGASVGDCLLCCSSGGLSP